MTESSDLSLVSLEAGRIERALGSATFQRIYARCASMAGVLLALGLVVAWTSIPTFSLDPKLSWSTIAGTMKILAGSMMLLMLLTSVILGLYISWRGSHRPLARFLASASGSIAVFTGLMCLVFFQDPNLPPPLRQIADSHGMWLRLLIGTVLLVTISLAMVVWMFSTFKFMLYFPKPIKLAGLDPAEAEQSMAKYWRAHSIRELLVGKKGGWRNFTLQYAALVAGLAMIVLVGYQADQPLILLGIYATLYAYVCWQPFAVISAKYKHVGDEDRRAIRWVTLGQIVWLALFLFLFMLVLVTRATGMLEFSDLAQSSDFILNLMIFSFTGFMTVLLATLAFSIFYHGTLDPDLVIRRTWVVALVGIVSGMLFVVVERLAADLLTKWFNVTAGTAFMLVGIFTAACIFPLRTWAERVIKRVVERWQSTYLLADGVREEAVIVFADLSGYTALTEKNEREALILAAIFHRDAERVAEKHRGRLIKTIGDAVMMRFPKADDAYNATKKLIEEYTNHAIPLVSAPLPIHAAIHRGEVVEGTNGDVFGATVNLAARLLGAAGPHEVVASEAAVETLSQKSQAEEIGSRAFKNVENPVNCFRLSAA